MPFIRRDPDAARFARIRGSCGDKRVRLRRRQRERGVAEDVRASILGKRSREYISLSGMSAVARAAGRMERARGSRAGLPLRPRHFPIARGPAGRDRAGGLFRSGDIREPAPTSAKALSSAPQGGPFSSASRRAAVSTNPAKTGFLHICEASGTLIQYQEGPTVPDHRQCFAQGRGLLGQSVPLHRPSPARPVAGKGGSWSSPESCPTTLSRRPTWTSSERYHCRTADDRVVAPRLRIFSPFWILQPDRQLEKAVRRHAPR